MLLTICSTTTNIILCCHNRPTCVILNSYFSRPCTHFEDDIPVHGSDGDASKKRGLMVLFLPANYERAEHAPHARGVAKNSLYLFVTESQRRTPLLRWREQRTGLRRREELPSFTNITTDRRSVLLISICCMFTEIIVIQTTRNTTSII